MPAITLPDGSQRHMTTLCSMLGADIGPGLAKACIGGRVNGELVDACDKTTANCQSLLPKTAVWRSFILPVRTYEMRLNNFGHTKWHRPG